MAIEDDVLVIGGGLAGIAAALSARERGARVRLVSHKQSTLRQASGLIDVLGYAPDGDDRGSAPAGDDRGTSPAGDGRGTAPDRDGPLVDPFDAIGDLPANHPYERAGLDAVRAGLDLFDDAVGERYRGGHTRRNALVPTHGGAVKPTARYPASAAAGLASDERDALLVGFRSVPDFDAPMAAAHLRAAGVPFEVRGVTVAFPGDLRDDAKVTRYADLLERDRPVSVEGGGGSRSENGRTESAVDALAERVMPHLHGDSGAPDAERVGFPALLGETRPGEVRAALEERLGVAVFEVPTGPPSLPGLRLEGWLFDALDEAGVRVTTGNPVVDYETANDRIAGVELDRNGTPVPHEADEYVLATGGLVGKGIRSSRAEVTEPVFGCHVPHPDDRYEWFEDGPFDDHAFARFGVRVDRELRPLDADGRPEFPNLRAAGSVLGGYDFAAEKSGGGVSLATGYAAGSRAGENA